MRPFQPRVSSILVQNFSADPRWFGGEEPRHPTPESSLNMSAMQSNPLDRFMSAPGEQRRLRWAYFHPSRFFLTPLLETRAI